MNGIHHSRRFRLSRQQHQTIVRSNKNANRTPILVGDTINTLPIEEKQYELPHSSSDLSSLFHYSSTSLPKSITISDDLTPLTDTTTTPLTALTSSATKQAETVQLDLTQLSSIDTLSSSTTTSDHNQSLSNINTKMKTIKDLIHTDDTDTSMKSVVFSRHDSLEQELSYQKHTSCLTIPDVGNGNGMTVLLPSTIADTSSATIINTNVNLFEQLPIRWNFQHMTSRLKLLIGCSSFLSLIVGIVILLNIL